jgi:hypothetical protein
VISCNRDKLWVRPHPDELSIQTFLQRTGKEPDDRRKEDGILSYGFSKKSIVLDPF